MSIVGQVESLLRYPVKSMRGEELEEAYVGFSGVSTATVYSPSKVPPVLRASPT